MIGKRRLSARGIGWLLVACAFGSPLPGQNPPSKPPGPKDKCAVCGMFVAEFQDFLAEIVLKNGSHLYFDGAKDMFRYYFEPEKYDPSRRRTEFAALYVTDYYGLNRIPAEGAFYVAGSDIRGPMGNELIPLFREPDAKTFLKDHRGKSVLRMDQLTIELINGLD